MKYEKNTRWQLRTCLYLRYKAYTKRFLFFSFFILLFFLISLLSHFCMLLSCPVFLVCFFPSFYGILSRNVGMTDCIKSIFRNYNSFLSIKILLLSFFHIFRFTLSCFSRSFLFSVKMKMMKFSIDLGLKNRKSIHVIPYLKIKQKEISCTLDHQIVRASQYLCSRSL